MTPYYPVEMGNGTPCSLRQNLPRSSTVMYICHPEAKHEILSVAEVTTCEYEVVILTPLLCNHPKYRYSIQIVANSKFASAAMHVFISAFCPPVLSGMQLWHLYVLILASTALPSLKSFHPKLCHTCFLEVCWLTPYEKQVESTSFLTGKFLTLSFWRSTNQGLKAAGRLRISDLFS